MRQKSLLAAYSCDRAFLYVCVTSAPSSVAARDTIRFGTARLYSRPEERVALLADRALPSATYQFLRILSDVTIVEESVPPD